MYDPNGNRMKKAVLPAVIQAKKPYYGTPPPSTPVLKKRVVKAPRPTSLPYQAPTTERQIPSASQDRPVYRQPERPERPAYQYQRPEPSQERTQASYEYPREEEPQQQTYKRAVEKVSTVMSRFSGRWGRNCLEILSAIAGIFLFSSLLRKQN